jgi:hypothetical protein
MDRLHPGLDRTVTRYLAEIGKETLLQKLNNFDMLSKLKNPDRATKKLCAPFLLASLKNYKMRDAASP